MKRFVFGLVAALLLLAARVDAQTITAKATWTTTDSPAVAQALVSVLKVGTTVVPMGAVTCVAGSPLTTCTASLTPPLAPGNYTLTVSNAFGSVVSNTFTGAGPAVPTLSITIIIGDDDEDGGA